MLKPDTRLHLIGIGGIGMSALARLYADLGFPVSGSDRADSPLLEKLRQAGVKTFVGHHPGNVRQANLVVCSTAIREDNPEKAEALRLGKTVWRRAQLLADLIDRKKSIVVTGCHGKTTTSGMIAWMMEKTGADPSIALGGEVAALGGNARTGKSPWLVAEGDESDQSFLFLHPDVAVVTNIDYDHPEFYRDIDETEKCFKQFLDQIKPQGTAVLCADDNRLAKLRSQLSCKTRTYGFDDSADIRAVDWLEEPGRNTCRVFEGDKELGPLSLQVAGRFNLLNALAAVAVSRVLEIPFPEVSKAMQAFPGVQRRMEWKGEQAGVTVLDDYGHHPAEVSVTLEALRFKTGGRKIIVFQPHRYSRTRKFAAEFARALEAAEHLIVAGLYPAGEAPIEGISARSIFDLIRQPDDRYYCETLEECTRQLQKIVQPGDTVLTLGAGPIHKVGEQLLEKLKNSST
jgi:UDP-N-acetylmuramate--alanine ligase